MGDPPKEIIVSADQPPLAEPSSPEPPKGIRLNKKTGKLKIASVRSPAIALMSIGAILLVFSTAVSFSLFFTIFYAPGAPSSVSKKQERKIKFEIEIEIENYVCILIIYLIFFFAGLGSGPSAIHHAHYLNIFYRQRHFVPREHN